MQRGRAMERAMGRLWGGDVETLGEGHLCALIFFYLLVQGDIRRPDLTFAERKSLHTPGRRIPRQPDSPNID